ncbi:thiamine phosphate synthase [Acinetobacter colistiniresistens]|uniref:8-oxo-dGTP diphosphatase n=1 Tax=Acinetobacter colistiniresistens TaxID=280145 RepID=S3TD43_9GAMM|nr:thiamine phosphate synthase [Acinetobacter colistiniresistens]EPG37609.1 7,8-dihydro-8-oxoguanine triphosphatase [Acinetobacter colistiniresistens]TVT85503.1 NUDIX domain-containing protein [Acinetobacter colistiniresistens]
MAKATVDVAIAILLHKSKVLVGWRQANQHQGNKHEFPGGKVELGETPEQACRREIFEEVGIGLKDWHVFDLICHEYDDIIVNLHLFHAYVPDELLNLIHQPWVWYRRDQLANLNFPKANAAILQRLSWPHLIQISDQLNHMSKQNTLFYWRTALEDQTQIDSQLQILTDEQCSRLIVNYALWQQLSRDLQAKIQTIHLKQSQLMHLNKAELVVGKRFIAACHDAVSLQHAHQIGCDAVFLGPVNATTTHPDVQGIGWDGFAALAQNSDIPVFALGGVAPADLEQAQKHHAYGLAGIRQFKL